MADVLPDLPDILSDKNQLPEKCEICKASAIGYHYDVASCNGCKAFFRRTIITGRRYQCKSQNKCLESIALRHRRICGACRFRKCIEKGMDPRLIKTELISPQGQELLEEVVKFRTQHFSGLEMDHLPVKNELNSVIQKLTIAENQMKKLRDTEMPENYWDQRSLLDVLKESVHFDFSNVPLSFKDDQLYPGHAGMTHNTFLSVIEHSKSMYLFSKITLETARELLLRSSIICSNMINSFYSIQTFGADNIRRQDGTIAGKPLRNYNGIWVDHRKIIQKTLHAFLRIKLNLIEYMFLKEIVICNPATIGISEQDQKVIDNERRKLAKHLLDYCLKQYGQVHGPDRFGSILSLISVLESQRKEQISFMEVLKFFHPHIPVLVSPLYDEIMSVQ